MFGVSVASFKQALTHRRVETAKDCVTKPLSKSEAIHARDALAKAIYSRLFSWLIERLNKSIEARATSKKVSMGVLDIYGFEIFRDNSFEQFIINYCNEKLQQVFIELVLHQEQEEYIREVATTLVVLSIVRTTLSHCRALNGYKSVTLTTESSVNS